MAMTGLTELVTLVMIIPFYFVPPLSLVSWVVVSILRRR